MTFLSRVTTGRLASGRRYDVLSRCRVTASYRYVAATLTACLICCCAHLLLQQTFLPPHTTDTVTLQRHPSTTDEAADMFDTGDDTSTTLLDGREGSHETGCDVATTTMNFDDVDVDHTVCCNTQQYTKIYTVQLLPRDAMRNKRGLCCRPVFVRPSVCPLRRCIVPRRLKISSNFFLGPVTPPF